MSGLLIIFALFALMWVLMIRPQRVKAQQQQRMLSTVAPGDEVLTVGGIYGIVQELEPEEDGGDLICEIAEGIHVRVARRSLATVVKPDDGDEHEDEDEDEDEDGDAEESGDDAEGDDAEDGDDVVKEDGADGDVERGHDDADDGSPAAAPPERS